VNQLGRLTRGGIALAALFALAGCSLSGIRSATSGTSTSGQGRGSAISTSRTPASSAALSGGLAQFQSDLRQLVDAITPSVVQIDTARGLGSGIVLDAAGDVVTNAHVVGSARSFTVSTSDRHRFQASLVGTYSQNDLAVVRVASAEGLKPATFDDSSQLHVGDVVLAVGSPLGLTGSVTEGIVSATGRSVPEGNGVTLNDLVQTSAAINPGNSGGALVDIAGHVVGIPTLGAGESSQGIGFAIPSNQVVDIAKQLTSTGQVTHTGRAFLGITTGDAANGAGARVSDVTAGSPADRAGIKAGWTITGVNGKAVTDSTSLGEVLSDFKPGDTVSVAAALPDRTAKTVSLTLGERPAGS
jgi:putative serine protease PepD